MKESNKECWCDGGYQIEQLQIVGVVEDSNQINAVVDHKGHQPYNHKMLGWLRT